MKFVCDSTQLYEACQILQRAASVKTTIEAVEGILIVAGDNSLKLTGYDLEMGITTTIDAFVEQKGKILLKASTFTEILRKLPSEKVSVESDARNIAKITSGEFKSSLIGRDPDEYPELPAVVGGYAVSIKETVFKDMIRKTIFSVAVKDTKIVHTGVRFEIENNNIRMIAVDGVRLAIRNEPIAYDGDPLTFVVPAKTLSEILKILGDGDERIEMSVGNKHIIMDIGGYRFVSRLLEGEFLNYRGAIPSVCKTQVRVKTEMLLDSVERTSNIINDKIKNPVKCSFNSSGINVSAVGAIGNTEEKISAEITGDECVIGFNNKYVIDALRVCDCDEVNLLLNGPIAPILIKPIEGDDFIFLILPVRLKNEN
ncbi:MAG: DNA polymerase III subunit beta [Clostridiales bacterium]|nr:DNA polymerase III subunit beta [Clostridiales bacterium]